MIFLNAIATLEHFFLHKRNSLQHNVGSFYFDFKFLFLTLL
jgi:hypothetical protein